MELLCLSDSHGRANNILRVLERQIKKPDGIIFLGDGLRDLMYCDFGNIPVYSVRGNCDTGLFFGDVYADEERIIELNGKRIMLTHGHKYGVKNGLSRLIYAAAERCADIVVFGHTHIPLEIYIDKDNSDILEKPLYIMNPGSVGGYDGDFGRTKKKPICRVR